MKKVLFIFSWIFFAISCEPLEKPSSGFGELDGNVYLKNESNPIQGLGVRVSGNKLDFTDSKGYFYLSKVPEGVQPLEVLYQMDAIYSTRVGIQSDKKTTVAIFLSAIKKDLPDFSVVNISAESDWDYFVAGKEEYIFMEVENSLPKEAVYHSFKQKKDYSISFDEKGLPTKIVIENYIFLFDNFNGTKVDFAIVSPSGEIQIIREASSNFNWDTDLNSTKSAKEVIKWAGRALGAIPCITTGAAALVSGGIAIPLDILALWNCGNYLLKISAGFVEDQGVHNGFTEFVNFYSLTSTAYNCTVGLTEPSSCLVTLAKEALNQWAENMDELEANESVHVAEAALYAGHGDVQITLTWDNESDLDLHVIDPFLEEIYYLHKNSASEGELDYDDIDGYGPENVYWPKGKAPSGTYHVFLHNFFWGGNPLSANYTVLITAFGKSKQFKGTIALDQKIHITDFNENGFIQVKSSDVSDISLSKNTKQKNE